MKAKSIIVFGVLCSASIAVAQNTQDGFQNFIYQVQLAKDIKTGEIKDGIRHDMTVPSAGERQSPHGVPEFGSRYELSTLQSDPFTSYLLDVKTVGARVPVAEVLIHTEDPYKTVPRTRADRPFSVEIKIAGLLNGASDPIESKRVRLLHHAQAYGSDGDGTDINRDNATTINKAFIQQRDLILNFPEGVAKSVPGTNKAKLRGEERFTIQTQSGLKLLDTLYVQIWPVSDGTISGITSGQLISSYVPPVTVSVNDIYPSAGIYAQVYQGPEVLGTVGTVISGSGKNNGEAKPSNETLVLKDWDDVITANGEWTMELLTETPFFGIDRLAWVTFNVDRTITVNASATTIE